MANRQQEPCKHKFVTHNNTLTTDGKPMRCLDLPRSASARAL